MTGDRIQVADYSDLTSRVDLSGREKDHLVADLNNSGGPVLAMENWLVDKKDITPMEGMWKLYAVSVVGESEKAWHVQTGEERAWVPKSQSQLFERAPGVEEISRPSSTLADFGGQR